jgi:hypothetical protein
MHEESFPVKRGQEEGKSDSKAGFWFFLPLIVKIM